MDIKGTLSDGFSKLGDVFRDAQESLRKRLLGNNSAPSDSGTENPAASAPAERSGDNKALEELQQRVETLEKEVETLKMLSWCAVAIAAAAVVAGFF